MKQWVITFDRPLLPAVLAQPPWIGVADLPTPTRVWKPTAGPVAAGNTVTFTSVDSGASFGPAVISYVPPPSDLFGLTGTPVAPFGNFPATVIP